MADLVEYAQPAAAIAGAASGALVNRSSDTLRRKIADGLAGALVGIFVGPIAADAASMINEHGRIAVCFAVGAIGYLLISAIIDAAKSGAIRDWIGKWVRRP